MELVGASWKYISQPFIKKGIINGLWSGLIAILALVCLLFLVGKQIPEVWEFQDFFSLFLLFGLIIITGVLISGVSTYYVVNKYLNMRLDDLY